MPKLTNEKREMIVALLTEGEYSIKRISETVGVSRNTVSGIKKELSALAQQLSPDDVSQAKYTKILDKLQSKYEKEQAIFEDVEEGWVYRLTGVEYENLGRTSGRWWIGIVYPESAPRNWESRLEMTGCEIAISPLHDKDEWEHDAPEGSTLTYKKGDKKKAHWHIIVKFPTRRSYKEVQELIRPMTNGPYLQKCSSLRGAYEYFIHLNHPKRYPYEASEIRKMNGFVVESTKYEKEELLAEVCARVRELEIDKMGDLIELYEGCYEIIGVISTKAYFISILLNENWRKNNPDKPRLVKLVNEE